MITATVLTGSACFLAAWRLQVRQNRSAGQSASSGKEEKQRWLLLAIVTAVSLSSPLWLPYTGARLKPGQLWISAIASWVFAMALIFIRTRVSRHKSSGDHF